jgi:hypothetical protein
MKLCKGHRKEPAVGSVQLLLDQRTLDRIQALTMLQQDALPGIPFGQEDAARQALGRGLDLMISELLLHHEVHNPAGGHPPQGATGA